MLAGGAAAVAAIINALAANAVWDAALVFFLTAATVSAPAGIDAGAAARSVSGAAAAAGATTEAGGWTIGAENAEGAGVLASAVRRGSGRAAASADGALVTAPPDARTQ